MNYHPGCHYLATAVLLLQFVFLILCKEKSNSFYSSVKPDNYAWKSLKNCDAAIHSRKVHVECYDYATSELNLPLFTNTTGILLTISMDTFQDIDDVLTQPSNSSYLKLISIRIQKLNSADSESLKHYNYFTTIIPKMAFFPLMLIRQMDMLTVFDYDPAIGIIHYNKTCLKVANNIASKQTNKNNSVDVSNCITSTEVVHKFIAVRSNFSFSANVTMEELFSKDFLSVSFVIINEIFFKGYNYSIPSVSFTTELFKFLPTESLVILSRKNVRYVEFQSYSILSIRNGDIPLIESLRTLNLKDCKIEVIEAKAFEGIVHLTELNLQGNRLKELPKAFLSLGNLNILNLQSNGDKKTNEFQYLDDILVNHAYLVSLNLSDMILLHFWENLGYLSKLEYLNLSNCSFDYIPPVNISYFMPSLTYLNLSRNNLSTVSIQSFSYLNKLQFLDISRNQLIHIPYNVIINILPSLIFFSLNANKIPEFLPLKLNDESALENLDLSFNKINFWNETRINSSYQFLNLNLIGNNITKVNSHMISDFATLKHVELAENPFDCKSCTLRRFLVWLRLENSSTDFLKTPYTCYFPMEYFKSRIANVTLESCQEEVFDWIYLILIPSLVVAVLLGSAAGVVIIYRWHFLYFIYLFQSKIQKYKSHDDARIFKYDAFVSYCSEDRNWVVECLIPAIEFQEPKLHLCVHERDFEIGETIMNNVIECIDSSHKSLFVLSECFIKSQWCQWELQMAQHKLFEDKRDVLIFIMLGEINTCETPKILKRLISKRTYLQWPVNENSHKLFWKRLKDAIGKCQCLNE